jgi:MscS family membrane protein
VRKNEQQGRDRVFLKLFLWAGTLLGVAFVCLSKMLKFYPVLEKMGGCATGLAARGIAWGTLSDNAMGPATERPRVQVVEHKQHVSSAMTTGLCSNLLMPGRFIAFLVMVMLVGGANARPPLEPVDTSSPRATMESFLTLTDQAAQRLVEYRNTPSPATQRALSQSLAKGWRLLDLSQVPAASREGVADETFVLLWDVLARLELPDPGEIPDSSAFMDEDEEGKRPADWQIPRTEITIARVAEGPRAGEFLFSPDTVKRLPDFYEAVQQLPYRRPMPSSDLVLTDQLLTGWMIPMIWVETLPDWANAPVLGQVLWKWFAVVSLIGLALAALIMGFRWARRSEWGGSLGAYVRRLAVPLGAIVLAMILRYFFQNQINLTGRVANLPDYLIAGIYGVAVVWLVWLTATWIAEAVIASPRISPESLDANLLRLAARTVGSVAALVLAFEVLHDVGIPVYGLVAGAGVGGIAVALATKSTLENFMGALNLYADHPVRVGDLCRYDGDSAPGWRPVGRIESIGLRSTKIRKLDRTLITIPNAEFAQLHIVNFGRCDRMLLATTLGLRYETTDDQLRFLLAQLRELLHAHPMTVHTAEDPIRARFVGYGDFSLNVAVRAYIRTSHYNEFLAVQEDILLRTMKVVKEAGTGFAFPSRTLYLGRDGGLDDERQQAAEKQVREWASAQTLPFPDFTESYRAGMTDTLDYPPEGSPDADRG